MEILKDEEVVYESLVTIVHGELREAFSHLLKLDEFPDVTVSFSSRPTSPKEPLAWLGTSIDPVFKDGVPYIHAVNADDITVEIVPTLMFLHDLGIDSSVDDILYQFILKEFIRTIMIYQLIKAHSIKYEYDRFIGERADKPLSIIMKPLMEGDKTLKFYTNTLYFYKEAMQSNMLGRFLALLYLRVAEKLNDDKTLKEIAELDNIKKIVEIIIREASVQVKKSNKI